MKPTAVDGGPARPSHALQQAPTPEAVPTLLLDAMMPDMDGFTLAERIKQNPAHAASAAIMMLTSGAARRHRALPGAGIAAYLIKPVQQSELLDAIMQALASPRRRASTAGMRRPLPSRHCGRCASCWPRTTS